MVKLTLPTDSAARKDIPVLSGCLNYAPAALAGMARWSKIGNDKHNPGQPLHHARGKSMDHGDTIIRHLMDVQDLIAALERGEYAAPEHDAIMSQLKDDLDALVWRAAMLSQEAHEKYFGAPLAPGARVPTMLEQCAAPIPENIKPGAVQWVASHPAVVPLNERCTERDDPVGYYCSLPAGHFGDHKAYVGHDTLGILVHTWERYVETPNT